MLSVVVAAAALISATNGVVGVRVLAGQLATRGVRRDARTAGMWVCSVKSSDSKPRSSAACASSAGAMAYSVGKKARPYLMVRDSGRFGGPAGQVGREARVTSIALARRHALDDPADRRSLAYGRARPPPTTRERPVDQNVSFVTLGVADTAASRRFYTDGLGWVPAFEVGDFTCYQVGHGLLLSLFQIDEMTADVGHPTTPGNAFTLSQNVGSRAAVDARWTPPGPPAPRC